MNIFNFENQTNSKILERGNDYYSRGAVVEATSTPEGDWTAEVEGSEDVNYEVEIALDTDRTILSTYCSCPFDGVPCKHEVAVYLHICQELSTTRPEAKKATKTQKAAKPAKRSKLAKVLETATIEELREFLVLQAEKNKELKLAVLQKFAAEEVGLETLKQHYRQLFVKEIRRYVKGDYLSYNNGNKLRSALSKLLVAAERALKSNRHEEAAAIGVSFFLELSHYTEYHDEAAAFDTLLRNTAELLLKVIVKAPALHSEILQSCLAFATTAQDMKEYYYPILTALAYSKEIKQTLISFAEKELEGAVGYSGDYAAKLWLAATDNLLTSEEQLTFMLSRLNVLFFCGKSVDYLTEKKAFDKAEEVLKHLVKTTSYRLREHWRDRLLKLYKQQGKANEVALVAEELLFGDTEFHVSKIQQYKTIKEHTKAADWPEKADRIIRKIEQEVEKQSKQNLMNFPHLLAQLYVEEKKFAELELLLDNEHKDTWAIKNYSKYFSADKYKPKLLRLYRKTVENSLRHTADRYTYKQAAAWLQAIADLGEKEEALALRNEMLQTYATRKAMREELMKVEL
jgi:hypothetical protein